MRCFLCGIRQLNNGLLGHTIKVLLTALFVYSLFHMTKHGIITSRLNVRGRSISENSVASNWHCELNKRMLKEMQKNMNERDRLLNYRGKVISKLRWQLKQLNETNNALRNTLLNLSSVVVSRKEAITIMKNQTGSLKNNVSSINSPSTFSSFLDGLKNKVDAVARPCCIALKRMTDILRVYMEETRDLKDQVAAYERLNITERMYEFAEREKQKFAVLNCSARFLKETENNTKRTERYSSFQMYSKGFFYETTSLNRAMMKQKFKSKGFHRNIDFTKAVNLGLHEVLQQTKLNGDNFEMNEGMVRYDEIKGAVYKLFFSFNGTRTFEVDIVKPYGPHIVMQNIEEQTGKQRELINIIVPLTKRTERLDIFLDNLKKINGRRENIYLTVVIYGTDKNNEIKNTIKLFSSQNNFSNYDILKKNEKFNRGRALHDGITRWNGYKNVLMFLCDIDIKFSHDFLSRCRLNTKLGKSIYMPIVYSLYNPERVFDERRNFTEAEQFNITEETGTWRPLGYGMLCFYRPDYVRARGFNTRITGWGGEDVNLYNRFLKTGIKVIRTPDPDLFHVWHEKHCDRTVLTKRQYVTCVGSKARYEGSQRQLGVSLLS